VMVICVTGLWLSANIFWIYLAATLIFLSGIFLISIISHQTFHGIVNRLFERHNILCTAGSYSVIRNFVSSLPVISTYCKVLDVNASYRCLRNPKIIWRETKVFQYAHCIDITDSNYADLSKHFLTKIDYQVRFADNDTEHAYKEHVDVLLKELPEYCKNGEKVTQKVVQVSQESKPLFLMRRQETLKLALSIFPFSLLTLPVFYFMLKSGFLCKLSSKFFIKKEVTSNNNMQIYF